MPDIPMPDLSQHDHITRLAFRLRGRMQQHLADISQRMVPLSELGAGMFVKQDIEEGWSHDPERDELVITALVTVRVGRSPSPPCPADVSTDSI